MYVPDLWKSISRVRVDVSYLAPATLVDWGELNDCSDKWLRSFLDLHDGRRCNDYGMIPFDEHQTPPYGSVCPCLKGFRGRVAYLLLVRLKAISCEY